MSVWTELPRKVARSLIPHRAYLRLARWYGARAAVRAIGPTEFRRLRHVASAPSGGTAEAFEAPGIRHPVLVRPGTTDAGVFEDNLLRRIYDCWRPDGPVDFVLDGGANAGYASVFFLNRHENAIVTAVEPDPGNFALLERNVSPYGARSRRVRAALWPAHTSLRILMSERADGISVAPVSDGSRGDCEGIDPLSLLGESGRARIDIFKCDIEGGEEFLFATDADRWLDRTDAILMEIHSPAARNAVYAATQRHGFRDFTYRELHVFARRRAAVV